ncbi:signal transduction histidine kinase [Isoptericola sp. CG 20/1183]|uniref:histidine kinase n=1 Tax=Isoptericola halotolerans TaxID=300560 RepID=A0ABX5EJZ2_9MICO|nr:MULTISPECIES: HAMP domain-containing sensor histidine kinase [Isoptericola]PRZ04197.1 signal transduction histidine kinase [Isoptericola sp. CG 20/1183]PRZ09978.1 signal transduction histidine kinase [Isoptericola halotolerans]
MRSRLAAVVYVPLALVILLLGMLYASSVTRAHQQEVFLDRLRDTSYLVLPARQAILADDPSLVAGDLERYRQVYGIGAAVVDQAGATVAAEGIEVQDYAERHAALAGRRAEMRETFWPWDAQRTVVAEPIFDGGDLVGALVTSSDGGKVQRAIWNSWALLAAAGAVIALLALVLADRTAGWLLRPVRAVDQAMEKMGDGRLDERIPPSTGPPELRQVVSRFNEMAERVEHLMRRQQEFVANASHELRNPLSALMLRVESLALSVPPEGADDVAHVRAEAERMAQILDALLLLADGSSMSAAQPVDVADLVARRVEGRRILDPDRELRLTTPGGEVLGTVDPTALESAFDTVVENAIKFAPESEPIDVSVVRAAGSIEVVVRDHGPGVPADQLERLTERFWRSPGHSSVRGSGLGLAIASELLAELGGGLRLELPDDGGLRVCLQVPAWEEGT